MSLPALQRSLGAVSASVLVLVIYAFVLYLVPKDVFWHPDEGAKFIQLRTVGWQRGLTYDVPYAGRVLDPQFRFYPSHCGINGFIYPSPQADGSVLVHWPIWFALLTRGFVNLFGIVGIYLLPLASGWALAVIAGRWAASYDSALVPIAILLVGCATPVIFYSLSFFEHTLASLLGVVAITALAAAPPRRAAVWWRAAPLLLLAAVLRVEMLVCAVALVAAWVVVGALATDAATPDRSSARRGARQRYGVGIGVLLAGAAAVAATLAPRHRELLTAVPQMLANDLRKLPYLADSLVRIFIGPPNASGTFTIATWQLGLPALCAAVIAPFVRSKRWEAVLILGSLAMLLQLSLVMMLSSQPYLAEQGALAVAPYMVVASYVWPEARRRRDHRLQFLVIALALYAIIGFVALFSSRIGDDGAYLIGLDGAVRYLLMLYPLGAVLAVIGVAVFRASDRPPALKSTFTILVVAMMLVSLQYQYRGVRMLASKRQVLKAWEQALGEQDRVVTDVWWLPAVLGPFFTSHEMYCIREPAELSAWLAIAGSRGVTAFTLASAVPLQNNHFGLIPLTSISPEHREVQGLHLYRFNVPAQASAPGDGG
jgi:hypothetical protein